MKDSLVTIVIAVSDNNRTGKVSVLNECIRTIYFVLSALLYSGKLLGMVSKLHSEHNAQTVPLEHLG